MLLPMDVEASRLNDDLVSELVLWFFNSIRCRHEAKRTAYNR